MLPPVVMPPIRVSVIQMILDGEKRKPSCVSQPEWELAKVLVKHYGERALGPEPMLVSRALQ